MSLKHRKILFSIFLITVTLLVYWKVQYCEFLNYDDQVYVTDNAHVRSGLTKESVVWALTSAEAGFWHPLTWLSLMLDYEVFHLNPAGYHWTNLLFHIANTLLLFWVLQRMTGALWRSGFVAALFALHPLHVESVAWVAERKDVLSAFFWMATIGLYVRYVERPGAGRYLYVVVSFILGLMAKPMVVTLPFVLLLLDYWPLGRFPSAQLPRADSFEEPAGVRKSSTLFQLVLEKIPLLCLAVSASILALVTQSSFGALSSLESFPFDSRIANAAVSYAGYIGMMIWPSGLSVFYPHPGYWPVWKIVLSGVILLAISLLALRASRRYPYVAVGWLWYLVTLLPVIGIIQLGSFAMADRFTYLSLIGLFIMITWGVSDFFANRKHKRYLLLIPFSLILTILSLCTWIHLDYWKNDVSLFSRAMEATRYNHKALHVLGMAYHRQGNHDEAVKYLSLSICIKPDESRAHNDLGVVYMGQQRFKDAEREFAAAVKLRPDNVKAINNLGVVLASQGKLEEAIGHFREAKRLAPEYESAKNNLMRALKESQQGP